MLATEATRLQAEEARMESRHSTDCRQGGVFLVWRCGMQAEEARMEPRYSTDCRQKEVVDVWGEGVGGRRCACRGACRLPAEKARMESRHSTDCRQSEGARVNEVDAAHPATHPLS